MIVDVQAEDFDRSRLFVQQAEDRPRQHRFAGARGSDKAQHFAAIEVEIEPIHHQMVAEAHLEAAHANDDFAVGGLGEGPRRSIVHRGEEHGEQTIHDNDHEDRLDHR